MQVNLNSLDVVNQAITNLLLGAGLALLNVLICYFAPGLPRFIRVLGYKNQVRAFIVAYLIALVLQMATSPIFRSLLQSVYTELAWSPYQAFFNVLGVLLVDVIVLAVAGVRRGAEVGGKRLAELGGQAADNLHELGGRVSEVVTPDDKETHVTQRQNEEQSEAAARAERQKRLDEKLKDY